VYQAEKRKNPVLFCRVCEKGAWVAENKAKTAFLVLFQVHFGHIVKEVLKLMNPQRKAKMPPVFPPPHFHVREIAFFGGNQPE
jgi:hypothetical protein